MLALTTCKYRKIQSVKKGNKYCTNTKIIVMSSYRQVQFTELQTLTKFGFNLFSCYEKSIR